MKRVTFNNVDVPKRSFRARSVPLFGDLQKGIVPAFSGKSALALLLRYFRSTGALPDKTAEVLVPPWLGTWVYITMHKYCFPTTEVSPRIRGILLYHQWGFPQRVKEVLRFAKKHRLFVIEDCAHAFEGYYGGKRLGTFGDAAIFSLAKFFPCVVGGAVYTSNPSIRKFAVSEIPLRFGPLEQVAFAQRMRYDKNPSAQNLIELERQYAIYDRLRVCHPQALRISEDAVAGGAIKKRKAHAKLLQEEFDPKDRFGLFEDDVAPWIIPLFFTKERMRRVVAALAKKGVESGTFHFDVKRNMFDPDYRECVALPCHDGITERELQHSIRTVRDAL